MEKTIDLRFSKEDWFSHNTPAWEVIFKDLKPKRILEVGSYEGRSACYAIQKALEYQDKVELFCVDSWEGGAEHIGKYDMNAVEKNFEHNMQQMVKAYPNATVHKIKKYSHPAMMELCTKGYEGYFDFVYIDGSHEAPDVLLDAILAHRLVKVDGVIAFDDYLWSPDRNNQDHYLLVKPAVDAYVNIYQRKVHVVQKLPFYQLYVLKLKD